MKLHPRIRKTAKWGGLFLAIVLAAAWIASAWWGAIWGRGAIMVEISMGRVDVYYFPDCSAFLQGWSRSHFVQAFSNWGYLFRPWFPTWESVSPPRQFVLDVPLSWLVVLSALITILAWRLDALARRREPPTCPKCRYDRTGLAPNAQCPECGASAPIARSLSPDLPRRS